MDKRKSSHIIESIYSFVGKCVIYSGFFCILFYLCGFVFNLLEPYITHAVKLLIENIKMILISVFISFSVVWVFLRVLDVIDNKIALKRLAEHNARQSVNVIDLN